jgi:hypothetical protein
VPRQDTHWNPVRLKKGQVRYLSFECLWLALPGRPDFKKQVRNSINLLHPARKSLYNANETIEASKEDTS